MVSSLSLYPISPREFMAAARTIGSLSAFTILLRLLAASGVPTFPRMRQASRRTSGKLLLTRPFVRLCVLVPSPAKWSSETIMSGETFPLLAASSKNCNAISLFSSSSELESSWTTTSSIELMYSPSTVDSSSSAKAAQDKSVAAARRVAIFLTFISAPINIPI